MMKKLNSVVVAAALALGLTSASHSATVAFSALPTLATPNPLATSTTGTVFQNVVGNVAGVRRSVWEDSPVDIGLDSENPAAFYSSVSANSSATYVFGVRSKLSFVWGSPDNYNIVEFLMGSTVVDTFTTVGLTLANIFPARFGTNGATATFTKIGKTGLFDSVRLSSRASNAFEYANVAAVPLPAGGLLLLGAMGGLATLRRRKTA